MCGGEASPASALHGPGKPKCSQLLKGPFNPLPASTPPLDLPGMQDTGTFITPLQALKGTDHFCACSTPHGEPSAPPGHQAYVPLATHTRPWHQHSQRPALAPKSQAVGKARKNAVLSGIRAGFGFLAPFGGLRGTLHKVLAGRQDGCRQDGGGLASAFPPQLALGLLLASPLCLLQGTAAGWNSWNSRDV